MPVSLAIQNYAVNIKGVNKMEIMFLKGNGIDASGMLQVELTRSLPQAALANCPHFIFMPEHYREDNTCRCNDKAHKEMKEWGYKWKSNRWQ
jgi:hypothetical protein